MQKCKQVREQLIHLEEKYLHYIHKPDEGGCQKVKKEDTTTLLDEFELLLPKEKTGEKK